MAIKQESPIVINCIDGKIGTYLREDKIGEKISIEIRPLNAYPWVKETIMNVPKLSIIEVPINEVKTNYGWMFIVSDGSGYQSPIMKRLGMHYDELIKSLDRETKQSKVIQSSADVRSREVERKIDARVQQELQRLKTIRTGLKRPGLLRPGMEDEGEF